MRLLLLVNFAASMAMKGVFKLKQSPCRRSMSTVIRSNNIDAETSLPRIVMHPLPNVYVYDHCPFCVRVRLALGLKNVKHKLHFLANDDVQTPTALVGKKVTPIFELKANNKDIVMAESLDIVAKIDSDPAFGRTHYFRPLSKRHDLKEWQAKYVDLSRLLQRPRYMKTVLPEFATRDSKDAYISNHPLPPHDEKEQWKLNLPEQRWALYNEGYVVSLRLIDQASQALQELDRLIYSEEYCTEGGLSLDDIELWSRLRSMTLVKDVIFPPKLLAYMQKLSKRGDVPLYFALAC